MDNLSAIIYGIIQGVTEFAPVSSSGHLALLPHFMQIQDPGVFFDLMMHLGTAFAVILYFRKDIKRYLKALIPALLNWKEDKADYHFVRNFVVATASTVIVILVIKDFAKEYGRDPQWIGINLFVFGALLFLTDLKKNVQRELSPMNQKMHWFYSILIGVSQSLAIFPGVSRSGITITSARAVGLNRTEASSFSFLLSLPIIFAGIIHEAPSYFQQGAFDESITTLLIGVCVSFIFGVLTIHYFLKLIAKMNLFMFFAYRALLAAMLYAQMT
jgi:undecaprenyl-diphosphatase